MPRNENMEFLESVCPPTVKDRSYEGLITWLFGGGERTIVACARVAYRDIQRNLGKIGDMPEQDKQGWRREVETLIAHCIDSLFTLNLSEQKTFDIWHNKTCEKIRGTANKHKVQEWLNNEFTYGLAQKWLNMTIKNMLTMEKWDTQLDKIKKYLHVPVDSYIMQAASETLGIKIIDKKGQFKPYKKGASKPWSRWDYNGYEQFQKEVCGAVDCPMDWEFSVWNKTKRGNA